jgi:hypothetical protein
MDAAAIHFDLSAPSPIPSVPPHAIDAGSVRPVATHITLILAMRDVAKIPKTVIRPLAIDVVYLE